jgi:hypothetical protein
MCVKTVSVADTANAVNSMNSRTAGKNRNDF